VAQQPGRTAGTAAAALAAAMTGQRRGGAQGIPAGVPPALRAKLEAIHNRLVHSSTAQPARQEPAGLHASVTDAAGGAVQAGTAPGEGAGALQRQGQARSGGGAARSDPSMSLGKRKREECTEGALSGDSLVELQLGRPAPKETEDACGPSENLHNRGKSAGRRGDAKSRAKRMAERRLRIKQQLSFAKNAYVAACLREMLNDQSKAEDKDDYSSEEEEDMDDFDDLADFIVCQPDRNYDNLIERKFRFNRLA